MPKTNLNAVERRTIEERIKYIQQCEDDLEDNLLEALHSVEVITYELAEFRRERDERIKKLLK